MLIKQSNVGLLFRFKEKNISQISKYNERLNYELDIIIKMGFAGYFLI